MLRGPELPFTARLAKMYARLRRQHARNPALLPVLVVGSFLAISLFLYLVSAGPANARPTASAKQQQQQLVPQANAAPMAQPPSPEPRAPSNAASPPQRGDVRPPGSVDDALSSAMPLASRALADLRRELDRKVGVQDFEECIVLRRMMHLVGEDREAGVNRDGDLGDYLRALRGRAEAAPAPARPSQSQQSPEGVADVALESDHRQRMAALQEQIDALQQQLAHAQQQPQPQPQPQSLPEPPLDNAAPSPADSDRRQRSRGRPPPRRSPPRRPGLENEEPSVQEADGDPQPQDEYGEVARIASRDDSRGEIARVQPKAAPGVEELNEQQPAAEAGARLDDDGEAGPRVRTEPLPRPPRRPARSTLDPEQRRQRRSARASEAEGRGVEQQRPPPPPHREQEEPEEGRRVARAAGIRPSPRLDDAEM